MHSLCFFLVVAALSLGQGNTQVEGKTHERQAPGERREDLEQEAGRGLKANEHPLSGDQPATSQRKLWQGPRLSGGWKSDLVFRIMFKASVILIPLGLLHQIVVEPLLINNWRKSNYGQRIVGILTIVIFIILNVTSVATSGIVFHLTRQLKRSRWHLKAAAIFSIACNLASLAYRIFLLDQWNREWEYDKYPYTGDEGRESSQKRDVEKYSFDELVSAKMDEPDWYWGHTGAPEWNYRSTILTGEQMQRSFMMITWVGLTVTFALVAPITF